MSALEVRERLDELRSRAGGMDAEAFDVAWTAFLRDTQPHL